MDGYTERDLKIAEELGGVKTMLNSVHEKIITYCENNERQHEAMWRKIDKHSKFINWLSGIIAVIGVALGMTAEWFRKKVGI